MRYFRNRYFLFADLALLPLAAYLSFVLRFDSFTLNGQWLQCAGLALVSVAVVPLAIPLLAGPGAISTMIIASHRVPGFSYQLKLLAPAGIIAVTVWITLRVSSHLSNRLGTTGMNIITRIMGLMLAALAVEFIAHGLQELFPGLA